MAANPTAKVSLKWTRYIPHEPTPRQAVFLSLPHREALYGGAAGGGKSDALLMAALQYVDQPGYAAILFRRTYADLALPEALMDRASGWLGGTDAKWHAQDKRWEFPSGATLSFGYLQSSTDRFRYQSAAFQFVGFDELTHFPEQDYRYLFSRLRRLEGVQVPVRMRAGSNPGGIGHEWVRQRFILDAAEDRVFVPAKLTDNPYLDQDEYRANLQQLDPVTRQQLLNGDWSARLSGGLFKREDFILVDAEEVPAEGMTWCRFWDLAGTEEKAGQRADQAYTAGVLVGRDRDGNFWVADVKRQRLDPAGVERLLMDTAHEDRAQYGPGVRIRQEQEPGSAGKFVIADFARKLAGFDYRGEPATGSKVERARPLSAAVSNKLVRVVAASWNGAFYDEFDAFPQDGMTRDQVDATSGAYTELAQNEITIDVF